MLHQRAAPPPVPTSAAFPCHLGSKCAWRSRGARGVVHLALCAANASTQYLSGLALRGLVSTVQRTCRVRPGGGCTGACLADLDSDSGRPCLVPLPQPSLPPLCSVSRPTFPLLPHPCPLASLRYASIRVRNEAERIGNCAQEDTIAGALRVAHGGEATRVALQRLGVSGPGAERPHLDLLPGPCTRGPQGDAAGAALATCGGAGKALPLQRVPGVGAWKGPWECYAPRRLCGFSSPTRLPLLLSSRGPQRWRGGGKGGGLADRAGWGAGARELGESE
ncbi:uncharacterized protein LOC129006658 [Pongo pygmaeus]|uniref:uncharacterized protein LOC129006658 n=1 Tax=Pongo pygmaeus TaxID=9600 RepID=UPI00300C7B6C